MKLPAVITADLRLNEPRCVCVCVRARARASLSLSLSLSLSAGGRERVGQDACVHAEMHCTCHPCVANVLLMCC